MNKPEQELIQEAFLKACALHGGERAAFLESKFAGRPDLLAEVESLLEHDTPAPETKASHEGATSITSLGPGSRIGEFVLVRELGRGGMGIVWEAQQPSLHRRVALKVLSPALSASSKSIERFQREAEAGARLAHPGLVAVHTFGMVDGSPFIAQELVEDGKSLRSLLDAMTNRDLTWSYYERMVPLFAEMAEAMQVAHDHGVIHRDLKPQNILLTPDDRPKIADFGLAMLLDQESITRTGDLSGTYFYMSPEQAMARRMGIDHRTDIFSLGATLYEALTLRRPFDGQSPHEVAEKILYHDPPDPGRLHEHIPGSLAAVSLKALEKRREDRYQTMAEFADDLRSAMSGAPVRAKTATPATRLLKQLESSPRRLAIVFLKLLDWLGDRRHEFSRRRAGKEGHRDPAMLAFESLVVRLLGVTFWRVCLACLAILVLVAGLAQLGGAVYAVNLSSNLGMVALGLAAGMKLTYLGMSWTDYRWLKLPPKPLPPDERKLKLLRYGVMLLCLAEFVVGVGLVKSHRTRELGNLLIVPSVLFSLFVLRSELLWRKHRSLAVPGPGASNGESEGRAVQIVSPTSRRLWKLSGHPGASLLVLAAAAAVLAVGIRLAQAEGVLTETEPPVVPPPGSSGGELLPAQAAIDVEHYALRIAIDPDSRTVTGRLEMTARVVEPTREVVLHLDELLGVSTVSVQGTERAFSHTDGLVRVALPAPMVVGDRLHVEVEYSGAPRLAQRRAPWTGGFTWSTSADGAPWFSTSCTTEGADLWWPCKDHPSDKPESMDLRITVPKPLVAVSNGTLESVESSGPDTHTFHWRIDAPICTNDVGVSVGPYSRLDETYSSVAGTEFPVQLWTLPQAIEQGHGALTSILDQLQFLEERLGPYPFRTEKCGFVQTPHMGANRQTLVAYGDPARPSGSGSSLLFHNLAHEWWGSLVSCADWKDLWVHEGIAAYMEALFIEERSGVDAFHELMHEKLGVLRNEHAVAPRAPRDRRQMTFGTDDKGNREIYAKGAWVLHTLRWYLGDVGFRTFLRRLAYPDAVHERATDGSQVRFVDTEDVRATAEQVAGEDLSWFFDVYLRQPELPRLQITKDRVELKLRWEVPEGLVFPMPVPLRLGGERVRVLMPDGRATITIGTAGFAVDPDKQILRQVERTR